MVFCIPSSVVKGISKEILGKVISSVREVTVGVKGDEVIVEFAVSGYVFVEKTKFVKVF